MRVKAEFYKPTVEQGAYQTDITSYKMAFSTGVKVGTVSFKDRMNNGQNIEEDSFYLFCLKNPNTLKVQSGWQVAMPGQSGSSRYVVRGVDPKYGKTNEIVFYVDRLP